MYVRADFSRDVRKFPVLKGWAGTLASFRSGACASRSIPWSPLSATTLKQRDVISRRKHCPSRCLLMVRSHGGLRKPAIVHAATLTGRLHDGQSMGLPVRDWLDRLHRLQPSFRPPLKARSGCVPALSHQPVAALINIFRALEYRTPDLCGGSQIRQRRAERFDGQPAVVAGLFQRGEYRLEGDVPRARGRRDCSRRCGRG